MNCAKTSEPIEMPFGVWTRVVARIPQWKGNLFLGGALLLEFFDRLVEIDVSLGNDGQVLA